jgi:hypothetical protein
LAGLDARLDQTSEGKSCCQQRKRPIRHPKNSPVSVPALGVTTDRVILPLQQHPQRLVPISDMSGIHRAAAKSAPVRSGRREPLAVFVVKVNRFRAVQVADAETTGAGLKKQRRAVGSVGGQMSLFSFDAYRLRAALDAQKDQDRSENPEEAVTICRETAHSW